MKEMAISRRFAARGKDYKKNPDQFVGTIGDYAAILRLAICAKQNTPNFYSVLTILGDARVKERINNTIAILEKNI
jgi:glutamyl-tRNA synthetase